MPSLIQEDVNETLLVHMEGLGERLGNQTSHLAISSGMLVPRTPKNSQTRLNAGTTKNDEGRVIVLDDDDELLETLRGQWERRKVVVIPGKSPSLLCPYVFHRNGRPIRDIRDVWHNTCLAAGLGQMIEVERDGKKKKKYEGKLFHDFRRTARRDNIRAGVPERVSMVLFRPQNPECL